MTASTDPRSLHITLLRERLTRHLVQAGAAPAAAERLAATADCTPDPTGDSGLLILGDVRARLDDAASMTALVTHAFAHHPLHDAPGAPYDAAAAGKAAAAAQRGHHDPNSVAFR